MALAILCAFLAALGFAIMYALIKGVGLEFGIAQLVFFRSLVALLIFSPMLLQNRHLLKTNRLKGHLLRSIFGLASMFCLFISAPHIPFTDLTLIIFTMPLFVTILSYPLLKEKVARNQYLIVIAGFIGIFIATEPEANNFTIYYFLAVAGSALYGLAVITIRQLGETEAPGTTFFYFTIICTILSGCILPFNWISPNSMDWAYLFGIGVFGGLAQFAMIKAYKLAPANLIAPIEYTQFLWAIVFGLVIWGEVPSLKTYIGALIIIGAAFALSQNIAKPLRKNDNLR
jgi:drug/metabolite transporter (DMT)-like permease